MDKNISVHTSEGELEYVEIDGVRYDSLDDIPEAGDRAKVEALLGASAEDDFDAPFDEAAFDKEFEEMQRESRKLPVLFVSIFMGVALIMLVIAVFSGIRAGQTLARQVPADGKVVDMIERRSTDSETGEIHRYAYPVIEFTTAAGTLERLETNEGTWPPAYRVGQAVTVMYDPGQPLDARIKSAGSDLLLWLVPGITGLLGAIFLAVALGVIWMSRPRKPAADDALPVSAG